MELVIPIVDFVCLMIIVLGIRWWQKRHGPLSERKYTMITLGYGTFFVITTMHSIYLETQSSIAIWLEVGLLLIVWTFGYAYARWLYKQFISRKQK